MSQKAPVNDIIHTCSQLEWRINPDENFSRHSASNPYQLKRIQVNIKEREDNCNVTWIGNSNFNHHFANSIFCRDSLLWAHMNLEKFGRLPKSSRPLWEQYFISSKGILWVTLNCEDEYFQSNMGHMLYCSNWIQYTDSLWYSYEQYGLNVRQAW